MENLRRWIGYDTIKLIVILILLLFFIVLLLQGGAQAPAAPVVSQAASATPASATSTPTATLAPSPIPPSPTTAATALPTPTLAPTASPQPTPTQTAAAKATSTTLPTPTATQTAAPKSAPAAQAQMALSVVDLVPGKRVRVQFSNLPANVEFAVRMGPGGSGAAGAPTVTHVSSPDGGPIVVWLEILSDLASSPRIDVRMDNAAGLSAVTTFDNIPAAAQAAPTATAAVFVANPSVTVLHVQKGGLVIAAVSGLPANTNYTITVGKAGTQGIGGYMVAHLNTGGTAGSSLTGTFEIPVAYRNDATLDLRLEAAGAVYVVNFQNTDF
jgi:hypothetical protein